MALLRDAPLEMLDRVVIAGSPARRQRGSTSMLQFPSGELLLLYRLAVGVNRSSNGAVMITRSKDGNTWEEAVPIYAQPGWDCGGMSGFRLLPDQSVVLFLARMRVTPVSGMISKITETHTYQTRSADGGHTWTELSEEIRVFPAITEFWGHGPVMKLDDGRLLLGVIGTQFEYERWASAVVTSTDNGRSFHDLRIIADRPGPDFCDNEIIRLADGRLLAIIRTEQPPFDAYQSYSSDDGWTWSPVQPTGFKAGGMTLLRLRSGLILCAHRDREPGRPGVAFYITEDSGGHWRYIGQVYAGTHWYCGYVDFATFPDGRIFCTYFTSLENGNSEVHGVWLKDLT
ncbi:MAG: exo-alpha-sialidase [Planctomycetes bacterium]|nr:exo-alpha-sialidase [Planctomycetota bacterium]